MTTETAWAHLPNARHIDRVLADLKARPEVWTAAWTAARAAARDAAWAAAWATARAAAWAAAWDAARDAARDAVAGLVAWDDVAYILTLPPDAVRMLIATCTDHHKHAAVMLLPASIAFETTMEGDRHAQRRDRI